MSSYLPAVDLASPVSAQLPAGMVAVRAAGVRIGSGELPGGRGAVLAGAAVPPGTMMTFCHPVVTAPAVIRGGAVLAGGWLPDFVRLGELERHLGEGVIEDLAAAAAADGRMPPRQRKRIMSFPLVIRLTVAMTLMPDASYAEALRRLAGLLAEVPFAREWHVPTSKVVTCWRVMVPPSVLQELFWRAAGPLVADDAPSAVMLAGMPVCGIDGMLVAVADTPANRAAFGCAGTSRQHGEGSAPFPQVQAVLVTARAGRATLGAIMGAARAGEQTLLARLIRRRPELFSGRVFVFGRNFPGHAIITAILHAGGHVVARIKDGISLPVTEGAWLPDGSRVSYLNAPSGKKDDRLPVRVAQHNVTLPCGGGQQVSETCTLATTLLDAPPRDRRADPRRLRGPLAGVGDHLRGGQDHHHRRRGPHLRPGAALGDPAAGGAGILGMADRDPAGARQRGGSSWTPVPRGEAWALRRREGSGPVTTDQVSFTTGRHHAIRSMTWSQVPAAAPWPAWPPPPTPRPAPRCTP